MYGEDFFLEIGERKSGRGRVYFNSLLESFSKHDGKVWDGAS